MPDDVTNAKARGYDAAVAERDRALAALAALCRLVRDVGGYLDPRHQGDLRHAEAVLVEAGR